MRLGAKLFQVFSRVPVLGDPLILANMARRTAPHLAAGRYRHAGAEVASGLAQAILDDVVPIFGRDLGHELTRLAFGSEYLEPSLLLGKAFQPIHEKREQLDPKFRVPADFRSLFQRKPRL